MLIHLILAITCLVEPLGHCGISAASRAGFSIRIDAVTQGVQRVTLCDKEDCRRQLPSIRQIALASRGPANSNFSH